MLAAHTRAFRAIWGADRPPLEPSSRARTRTTRTLFYGDRFALKLLRKVEEGPHPEQEIGALLTKDGFPVRGAARRNASNTARRRASRSPSRCCTGIVRDAVEGWQYTLDHLGIFYENALARGPAGPSPDPAAPISGAN